MQIPNRVLGYLGHLGEIFCRLVYNKSCNLSPILEIIKSLAIAPFREVAPKILLCLQIFNVSTFTRDDILHMADGRHY